MSQYIAAEKEELRMPAKKRSSGKRELINTGRDKRFVKRTASGKFKESDDVGKSLSSDRKRSAKRTTKSGFGDQGDQKKRSSTRKRATTTRAKKK
jgi:hypothetical protein